MNILITLLIEYFLPNKLFKKGIFCLCFITYIGHLILGNILFMFHHIHGTFKFRKFGAAASNNSTPTASNPPEGKTTSVIAVMRGNSKDGYTRQHSNKHCK
jgi:hypothetical protein